MSLAEFKVIAIIAAFNEGDIIGKTLETLAADGIDSYLIDNHSTDDTVLEAQRWLGRGLVGIETFPPGAPSTEFAWAELLRRKEELAFSLEADWFIHHDADEIRQSPFPDLSLKAAIHYVDRTGYNCIDFRALVFPPTDDGFRQGDDPATYFQWFEDAASFDQVQRKCWKSAKTRVSLAQSGGHDVDFPQRLVFPVPFLLRHYPIRSQAHGVRKVLVERKPRYAADERERGWHVQYDQVQRPEQSFLRDPAALKEFDLDQYRLGILTSPAPSRVESDYQERQISGFKATLAALERRVRDLTEENEAGRVRGLGLDQQLAGQEREINGLNEALKGRERQVRELTEENEARGIWGSGLKQDLAERDQRIAGLDAACAALQQQLEARNQEIDRLSTTVLELGSQNSTLSKVAAARSEQIAEIYRSTSWRSTEPLRSIARRIFVVSRSVRRVLSSKPRG